VGERAGPLEDLDMSAWRERKVFVSGAAGLLGSWMAEELLRRGAEVTCLIRDWVPNSRAVTGGVLDRCQVVRGDLEDFALLLRTLNEYEIDSIFHLGAQAIVGTANRSPLSTFESNIRGTWTLLEAARQCPRLIERIVVASSDKAYGAHDTLPYTETTALLGRFPYDVSKACGDLIALSYAETYGLPLAVTRCGNLYGGGDLNFSRLIPGTIRSALRGESPLIRSDGTFVRDYFFVRDAVNAYLHLADRLPAPGIVGEAFNLGPESPLSVLEVVDRVLTAMDRRDLEPVVLNEARHEIPHQYLDCAKARERLDWKPEFSFEQGLRETIEWYRTWLAA
jgi:CDP-glucose 4,6-dehydratase